MKLEELKTIKQVSEFVDGTQKVIFQVKESKSEKYTFITKELVRWKYSKRCKKDKSNSPIAEDRHTQSKYPTPK